MGGGLRPRRGGRRRGHGMTIPSPGTGQGGGREGGKGKQEIWTHPFVAIEARGRGYVHDTTVLLLPHDGPGGFGNPVGA
jgi:hypothetical protein